MSEHPKGVSMQVPRILVTIISIAALSLLVSSAGFSADRIYVSNGFTIFEVDPMTGDRSIVSASTVGDGPSLIGIYGIAVESSGQIVAVLDGEPYAASLLLRIDPATGNRVQVAQLSIGSSTMMSHPRRVVVDQDGSLLVTDFGLSSVVRVDPVSGDKTTVTATPGSFPQEGWIGNGPSLTYYRGIAVERDRSIVLAELALGWLVRVDPATGNRTVFSASPSQPGPELRYPLGGIAVERDNTILVPDVGYPAILRVDPITGNRSFVSGDIGAATLGSGPMFKGDLYDIAVLGDGSLLVTDCYPEPFSPNPVDSLWAVLKVNPNTGDRTILSGPGVGAGPAFAFPGPRAMAVDVDQSAVGEANWREYK